MVYRLSKPQHRVITSAARFIALNAGRRFGKTHLATIALFIAAVNTANAVVWYVAPTYRQAKQIAWGKLKAIIPPGYIRAKDETDLRIELRNGSVIALRGSDNPDSLRGVGLDFLVMDECAFQSRDTWTEALRPALSDKQGRALFISTPCGFNWFYDLYCAAKGKPDWETFQFTTLDGGNVPQEEIEAARIDMDERTFKQEYLASFESLTGRVYYAYDREANAMALEDNQTAPLLVGMDFNVNPMTAALAIRAGDQLHFIGEILMPNGNTEDMAAAIRSRFPKRSIAVCPDPTGNARKTSAPVGQTDFSILRAHGFDVRAPRHPYAVVDKVNMVNAAMKTATGVRRVFVDPLKCVNLARAFDGLTYREGTNEPDKSSGLDHISDAAAYLIAWEYPIAMSEARGLL